MSYSSLVKSEITREELGNKCCQRAELSALIRINGSLSINSSGVEIRISNESAAVARRAYLLVKNVLQIFTELLVRKDMHFGAHNQYEIKIPAQGAWNKALKPLGIETNQDFLSKEVPEWLLERDCCKRAFVRGAFLAAGSVSSPDDPYHLEIRAGKKLLAEAIQGIMATFAIEAGLTAREDSSYFVYLKNYSSIAATLALMGANSALLRLENSRVVKEIKNDVNRQVNCETANLNRTIQAAMQQVEDIELIIDSGQFNALPESLQEIAHLRLDNPYVSLKELGELLQPSLSKSGVNNRLRRIARIAEQLRSKGDRP
ncbi:MAG: DNA-binding protein WhiA [Halanaerobium sp.]|nr:DNA-binding protein WhiA [Halanaerobium sp.]